LANRDDDILDELYAELKLIKTAIAHLEARRGRRSKRGRQSMPPAERRQVSKRMKAYWAKWRAERAAAKK
jgi:hypothetical protein